MYKIYSKSGFLFSSLIEVWKDVVDWEECYQVSSFGSVRSKDKVRVKVRQGKTVLAFYRGREMKRKLNQDGYRTVHLRDEQKSSHPSVHRLVALTFVKNTEHKPTVNHKDGNKQNNNVSNLEWATHSEQTIHAFDTGLLKPRGAPVYSPAFKAKVYDYFLTNNCSINELKRVFDISQKTASSISQGITTRQGLTIPDESVPEIIKLRNEGWTLKRISEEFNCGISQIHRITKGMSRNLQYERN